MALTDHLNKRYATKQFDPSRKLTQEEFDKVAEAIRLSASSLGLQAYRIFVVENPELRKKLRTVSWDQPQITDASHLLVFAVDHDFDNQDTQEFIDMVAKVRNIPKENLSGFADMINGALNRPADQKECWLTNQIYIALGFGLVAAAEAGVDSCPMEGFDPAQYDEILGLAKYNLKTKVVLTLGHRSTDDKYQHLTKVRRTKEELFINL